MKKMCLITNTYPYGSGESTFILPEIDQFSRSFDVTLVSCGSGSVDQRIPEGVNFLTYSRSSVGRMIGCLSALFSSAFWHEALAAGKAGGLSGILGSLLFYADAFQFGRWFKKHVGSTDLVYTFWHTALLLGVLINKCSVGDPVVVSRAHGYDLYHDRSKGGYQPFKQYCDRLIDRVFLVSQAGCDYYEKHYSVSDAPKYELRHLGADNDRLSTYEPDNTLRVYSCSYLWDIKRIDLIIEALALVDRPVSWIHFGDGPLADELKSLAAEKLDAKFGCSYTFAGTVANSELRDYVASHPFDCFVTASMSEGLPVSIMEALSFGIPAVATNAGGIYELVNEHTGILLPIELTAQELANAFERIKQLSADETRSMRKAAYEHWRSGFVASDNARALCDELMRLCDQR